MIKKIILHWVLEIFWANKTFDKTSLGADIKGPDILFKQVTKTSADKFTIFLSIIYKAWEPGTGKLDELKAFRFISIDSCR